MDYQFQLTDLRMIQLLVLCLVGFYSSSMAQVPGPLAVRDYCPSEYFNATCPPGHVILIRSAKYGRMSAGRCVTANHGFLGCSTEVLPYMDGKCSGRQKCKVYIAEPELHDTKPCPRDFASYLSAAYECIKVAQGDEGECRGSHEILLTDQSGFISSQLHQKTQVGTDTCPWRIRARRGQKVAIKLFKFGRVIQNQDSSLTDGGSLVGSSRSNVCYELATIKENGQDRTITTCTGDQRESLVYHSESSMVDIAVLSPGSFLIHYQAEGCPEPHLPKNVWVRRQAENLIVKCNMTEETWSLVCRGNSWVGEVGNCSKDKQTSQQWSFPILATSENQFPYGILILVAIGVALGVFLGGLLLSLAIFYLKRKSPHEQNTPPHLADIQCEHPKLLDGENNQIPPGTWGRTITTLPHTHHVITENPGDIQRGNYIPACDVTIDVKDCNHSSTYDRRRGDRCVTINGNGTLRSHHYESPQFT